MIYASSTTFLLLLIYQKTSKPSEKLSCFVKRFGNTDWEYSVMGIVDLQCKSNCVGAGDILFFYQQFVFDFKSIIGSWIQRLYSISHNKSTCPSVLKIKTTSNGVDIYNFASKKEVFMEFAFH